MSSNAPSSGSSIPTCVTTTFTPGRKRSINATRLSTFCGRAAQYCAAPIASPNYGDLGMSLQELHGFLVPGTGKHHRHREGKAGVDEPLQRSVYAVTEPSVVGADDQVHRTGSTRMFRRAGLTEAGSRRGGKQDTTVHSQ